MNCCDYMPLSTSFKGTFPLSQFWVQTLSFLNLLN